MTKEVNTSRRASPGFVKMITVVCLLTMSGVATAQLPERYHLADLKALQEAFVELAENVRPSVVAIRTYQDAGGRSDQTGVRRIRLPYSQGSGMIIDKAGHIATNRHVIEDSDAISVILNNGLKFDAEIIATDRRSDLAVLKIDAERLTPVVWGDGSKLKVNQWVFACGNPFGLANSDGRTSLTYGAVSSLHRQMTERLGKNSDVQYYGNMIETSATINPGNSGGPLFDVDGKVVGVVTAIETSSGVSEGHGFAITVGRNTRRILKLLVRGEEVHYGFLGVQVTEVDASRSPIVVRSRAYRGAELTEITPSEGPAARAGLKPRDIVIEYDGTAVENSDHLIRLVGYTPVGTKIPVTYLRRGVKRTAMVTIGDRATLMKQTRR